MSWALVSAAMIFGTFHIVADYHKRWTHTYVLKPATMAAIVCLVFVPGQPVDFYSWAVLVGLLFSLGGDIFLMLRPARFLPGLVSFLVAHLVYVTAFAYRPGTLDPIALLAAVTAGTLMLWWLWPGLGKFKGPVTLYVVAISAMVATAVSAAVAIPDAGRLAAAAGAILFLASDACLGYARFRRRFPAAQGFILGSYYPAQALIALSAGSLYA